MLKENQEKVFVVEPMPEQQELAITEMPYIMTKIPQEEIAKCGRQLRRERRAKERKQRNK